MKKLSTVLIALSSLAIGFALSSFYSAPAPVPSPTSLTFSSANTAIRVVKGAKQTPDNYYLNILTYAADSITLSGLDSFNTKQGLNIAYNDGNYIFNAESGTIDSIPRSVCGMVYCTLVDTTIYSRYGVIYGKDNTGKKKSFSISDVVSTSGSSGTVTFGIVNIEVYE